MRRAVVPEWVCQPARLLRERGRIKHLQFRASQKLFLPYPNAFSVSAVWKPGLIAAVAANMAANTASKLVCIVPK